jgi:hypothetical protein
MWHACAPTLLSHTHKVAGSQRRSDASATATSPESCILAAFDDPLSAHRHMQIERRNSFQFSGHTVKIKDRRIFHDFCNFFYDIQFKIYLVK